MKTVVEKKDLKPFLHVSLVWLMVGAGLCVFLNREGPNLWPALKWMFLLWATCVFDLYALVRALGAAVGLMSDDQEKRSALLIQAFYWGAIKLACLGILGLILFRGSSIPASGLLIGSATLVVVPLVGGYWWSQKVLHHAS